MSILPGESESGVKLAEAQDQAVASHDVVEKVVVVGHVDHGKSTLLGRLLIDSDRVEADRLQRIQSICSDKGVPFEPAFLLDAFEEEQSQGVSIDSTRFNFEHDGRRLLFIDAPGHLEFIKNMTGAAASAELAILVVDAVEGIRQQTVRHLQILSMLGIAKVIVVVNKIDKVAYSADAFTELSSALGETLKSQHLACVDVVPISALFGENLLHASSNMPWYSGKTLIETVISHSFQSKSVAVSGNFRMLLQDVYRFDDKRYFAGRIVSGTLTPGKFVYFSPSGKASQVESIITHPDGNRSLVVAGDSVALLLSEQIFVERGEIISMPDQAPEIDDQFTATLVWLSPEPMQYGSEYVLKIGTAESSCQILALDSEPQPEALTTAGEIVHVLIKASNVVAFDRTYAGINKFVLCSSFDTIAAGVISDRPMPSLRRAGHSTNVRAERGYVEREKREMAQKHKGAVLWLTGLSGSGKSTIAKSVEAKLFASGCNAVTVDADNLRMGLCSDLGFSQEDRAENVRRISEVAKLLLDSGTIVLVACLSPYSRDRELARSIIGGADFYEVFISCPMDICRSRDPKGLYRKAVAGEISSFSGFTSPYQPPTEPALRLDSSEMSIDDEVSAVIALLKSNGVCPFGIGE